MGGGGGTGTPADTRLLVTLQLLDSSPVPTGHTAQGEEVNQQISLSDLATHLQGTRVLTDGRLRLGEVQGRASDLPQSLSGGCGEGREAAGPVLLRGRSSPGSCSPETGHASWRQVEAYHHCLLPRKDWAPGSLCMRGSYLPALGPVFRHILTVPTQQGCQMALSRRKAAAWTAIPPLSLRD